MKSFNFSRKLVAVAALALLSTGAAMAGTNGDTVNARYFFPDASSVYSDLGTAVVGGAGANFSGLGYFQLHVTDTQIIADHFAISATWGREPFNGFKVSDLTKDFSQSYSVDGSTNMVGFSAANVAVNGAVASINWNNLSFNTGTRVVLNISAVPEPETYAMLVAGLALLGVMARRRKA